MSMQTKKQRLVGTFMILGLAAAVGCSDDVTPGDGCGAGESFNPITGQCVPVGGSVNHGGSDAGSEPDGVSSPDASPQPDAAAPPDTTPTDTGSGPGDVGSGPDAFDDVESDVPEPEPADPNDPFGRECLPSDLEELVAPIVLESVGANYRLALDPGADAGEVQGRTAHVFEDVPSGYAGFVFAGTPTGGQIQARELVLSIYQALLQDWPEAVLESEGRAKITHDHYRSQVLARIALPAGVSPDGARDTALGRLASGTITHGLTGTIEADDSETLIDLHVVARNATQYVVIAAFTTRERLEDDAAMTGIRVYDLVSGTALARRSIDLERACTRFDVRSTNQVDIIISMDASGSMGDELQTLSDANFLTEFVGKLDESGLDWRIGVTGTNCSNIRRDTAISQEFRDLWPSGGGLFNLRSCEEPSFGGIGGIQPGGPGNGYLMGNSFTTNVTEISQRLNQVSTTASEFTLTMGLAAADRAQPRGNAPDKIRPNAAVVIVAVTDEEDQLFADELGFLPLRSHTATLTPAQYNELELYARPFLQFTQWPHIGATVFGLYGIPGVECPTTADYSPAIQLFTEQTGGNSGSICQPDIRDTFRDIADVAAGLAQGYRLPDVPVASTLTAKHADMANQQVVPIARSRQDGFDYEAMLNRMLMTMQTPPEDGDRIIVPYMRWAASLPACETVADCPADKKVCIDGECS
jgi:hypothetical protein